MFDAEIGEDREHSGSFLYLSIPRYALRELWLSTRARNWTVLMPQFNPVPEQGVAYGKRFVWKSGMDINTREDTTRGILFAILFLVAFKKCLNDILRGRRFWLT